MLPRSRKIILSAVFIFRIRKSIGREISPVTSALSFRFCHFWPQFVSNSLGTMSGSAGSRRYSFFLAAAISISLSILIKLPSAIVGAPLACMVFQGFGFSGFRRVRLWAFAAIALLPAAIWYWHAYQVSLEFYPHHFFGAGGVRIMSLAWYWNVAAQIPTSTLTPIVFLIGIAGLFVARSTSSARPSYSWLAAMLLFIVLVGYG